jgi:threonine/homoserine efflux transporter RhtA
MLWGTCGTAQTFAPPGFDPMVVGMMRIVIGGTALNGCSLLTLAEPLTAGLLGVLVVGEYLTGTAWCGLFLLLCGLFLLAFPWRKINYSWLSCPG